jgi:hypothetical protein
LQAGLRRAVNAEREANELRGGALKLADIAAKYRHDHEQAEHSHEKNRRKGECRPQLRAGHRVAFVHK